MEHKSQDFSRNKGFLHLNFMERVIEQYKQLLEKKCGIKAEDNNTEVLEVSPMSKGGHRLLVIGHYGDKVYEFIQGNSYQSAKVKGFDYINYDEDTVNTKEIIETFGIGSRDDQDIQVLADALANCEDWDSSNLEEDVINHVVSQTSLVAPEVSYVVKAYFAVSPKERLLMNLTQFVQNITG